MRVRARGQWLVGRVRARVRAYRIRLALDRQALGSVVRVRVRARVRAYRIRLALERHALGSVSVSGLELELGRTASAWP
eukprot:scaffold101025_cov46-Phaeocystis_antarctica.AAC.1